MWYARARNILILLFFVIGIVFNWKFGFEAAWHLYLAALLMLAIKILLGDVFIAMRLLQRGKTSEAEQLINMVRRPSWLTKRARAYFFFVKGVLALQRKNTANGQAALEKAVGLGKLDPRTQALGLLNLGHIAYLNKDFSKIPSILDQIKSMNVNDLKIKDGVRELEKVISQGP